MLDLPGDSDRFVFVPRLRNPPPGLIDHSDRSSQYATYAYQKLLNQHGWIGRMSRKGNCWDTMRRWNNFNSLKREWTCDQLHRTRKEAIIDIREYVAVYYNSRRLHSTLGYKTPMDYEKTINGESEINIDSKGSRRNHAFV